jgi:leader peptidase (prepilin peptidase) / N-methyltransferase
LVTRAVGVVAVAAARASVTVVAVVAGLLIGSFLNVVVYRVPRGLSVVQPGSFCPACHTPIRPSDNVPVVSWLVLRARCRVCGEPISARYPLVELGTGAIFGAAAWALGAHWAVPGMCALGATIVALTVIEFDGLPASAAVALIGTGLGASLLFAAAVADRRWWHLGGLLIGIAVASAMVVAWWAACRGRGARTLPWALVPAGAVMGWVGPVGALVGVATSAVGVAGLSVLLRVSSRRHSSNAGAGIAFAVAIGTIAAVIGALIAGSSIGT